MAPEITWTLAALVVAGLFSVFYAGLTLGDSNEDDDDDDQPE